jgi:putative flippase GtrA
MIARPGQEGTPPSRRQVLARQGRALLRAIQEGDEAAVESAVIALSRSRRIFAPLVFAIGAFAMLFQGLRLLVSNWRLTLIQVLPAMWIWVALLDLKAHVFKGKEFHDVHGPVVIALIAAIALLTVASFYLNAVFAFAISQPGKPRIRPAFTLARRHLGVVLGVGLVVGLALGFSAIVVPRWGRPWFTLSLGIVVGVMMLTYVTVPARIVGIRPAGSRRDKLAATLISGTIGALVCTPPYVIGRIGILLLGSNNVLFALGVVLLALGLTLQAGATGAVKAIKMSAKLAAGTTQSAVRASST